jgi:hypothetical protein
MIFLKVFGQDYIEKLIKIGLSLRSETKDARPQSVVLQCGKN